MRGAPPLYQGCDAAVEVPRAEFLGWLLTYQEEAGIDVVLQRPGSRQEVEDFCSAVPGDAPYCHGVL